MVWLYNLHPWDKSLKATFFHTIFLIVHYNRIHIYNRIFSAGAIVQSVLINIRQLEQAEVSYTKRQANKVSHTSKFLSTPGAWINGIHHEYKRREHHSLCSEST